MVTVIQPQEKQKVLEAIRDLGRRVTAADVATKTGLPLHISTLQLNTVAAETGGHLEVSTTGDIAYTFAPSFQNAYLAKGIQRFMQQAGEKAFEIGFYLLRISFGIMLILSLLIVVVLFILIMLRMGGRDGDRDGGRDFDFGFFDFLILRDLFYWGAYSTTYQHYPSTIGYDRPTSREHDKGNFLLNCFSFLFGDGNPNQNLEERKWQLVAQSIKNNDGVVTAEQLAPYTGANPKKEEGALPALVRFNGRPEVTESGNIVYAFPSLQVSAAHQRDSGLPAFLREWPWQFSNASADALIPVYILAAVNLLGSFWLWTGSFTDPLLNAFQPLITILVIYGTLFVAVPTIRWICLKWLNSKIEARNSQKQRYAQMLQEPSSELLRKLQEAQQYEIKEQRISADQVVYTTEKAALEQKDELDEKFEKMIDDSKSSPRDDSASSPQPAETDQIIQQKLHRKQYDKDLN